MQPIFRVNLPPTQGVSCRGFRCGSATGQDVCALRSQSEREQLARTVRCNVLGHGSRHLFEFRNAEAKPNGLFLDPEMHILNNQDPLTQTHWYRSSDTNALHMAASITRQT